MAEYDETTYGDRIADVYDDRPEVVAQDTEGAVALLTELAGSGPVLELGIGTGRIALPLSRAGLVVRGIDASERMVARLREKPGGRDLPVTIGNFADVGVEGTYTLVFVAFNTLFALLSQEDQVRCFENVAAHLSGGGRFVTECFVPDVSILAGRQRVSATRVEVDEVSLDASRYDLKEQRAFFQHVILTGDGTRLLPGQLRYAWPAELDLMARLAGLRLKERWGGWHREPFTAQSGRHVSVYGKP